MGKKETDIEDQAIQDTLTMTVQERLELLASLIVDKIAEDEQDGRPLLDTLLKVQNG